MEKRSSNKSLQNAKDAKNDEFYTRFDDIQAELNFYKDQLKDKVIYCNCDDPAESAFTDFFKLNFDYLGIKKLICTRYQKSNLFTYADPIRRSGYRLEITNPDKKPLKINLKGDGDFRSPECVELLEQADVIVTNPPFSLFREYTDQLVKYNKKFLIIGNKNAITYKEIFKLIKGNKLWIGYTSPYDFIGPDGNPRGNMQGLTRWFTNLDVKKRHEDLILYKTYKGNEKDYPKYDNYDAINVDRTKDIPKDYAGIMGVPISFLDNYNPEQFEILGSDSYDGSPPTKKYTNKAKVVDGKRMKSNTGTMGCVIKENDFGPGTYFDVGYPVRAVYKRIFIKHKKKII